MRLLEKELLGLGGTLIALGIAWGTLTFKVNAQGTQIEKNSQAIPTLEKKQVKLETKIDYLIDLLECKYGIKACRLSELVRPGP